MKLEKGKMKNNKAINKRGKSAKEGRMACHWALMEDLWRPWVKEKV